MQSAVALGVAAPVSVGLHGRKQQQRTVLQPVMRTNVVYCLHVLGNNSGKWSAGSPGHKVGDVDSICRPTVLPSF